jgi:hypothetical protein
MDTSASFGEAQRAPVPGKLRGVGAGTGNPGQRTGIDLERSWQRRGVHQMGGTLMNASGLSARRVKRASRTAPLK